MPKSALADVREKALDLYHQMLDEGAVTLGSLLLRAKEELSEDIELAASDLVDVGLRDLFGGFMKRPLRSRADHQTELPLGIDQELVPEVIAIRTAANDSDDPMGRMLHIRLRIATIEEIDAHLDLLDKGIEDDIRARDEFKKLRDRVWPIMRGTRMTFDEAIAELKKQEEAA